MSSANSTESDVIGPLIRKLVSHYIPPHRYESALQVTSRLLDSALTSAPSIQNPASLQRTMLFRLVRDHKSQEAQRLAGLTTSLKFEKGMRAESVWPILYVLNDLRGTVSPSGNNQLSSFPTLNQKDTKENGTNSISPPSTEIVADSEPHNMTNGHNHNIHDSIPFVSKNPFQPGSEPTTVVNSTAYTSDEDNDTTTSSPSVIPKQLPAMQLNHEDNSITLQNRSLEKSLVQDLVLIVQGEDGKYIKFSGDTENETLQFVLPLGTHLSVPIHDIVMHVGEIGFLFRVIRRRVDSVNHETDGQVAQNMCTAIIREIDNYYRSLVTLRGYDNREDIDDDGHENLTLRTIFAWVECEKPRFRWLARLCEETRSMVGGEIIAHLQKRRGSYISGDIRDMMSRLIASTAAPINRMLIRWVSEGVVMDPGKEFFIMEDPKIAGMKGTSAYSTAAMIEDGSVFTGLAGTANNASAASNRIWWGLFRVRKEQLPGFVDTKLAQKALMAGKSIAFLRRCCSDSTWVDQYHAPMVTSLTSGSKKLFEADTKFDKNLVRELIEKTKESASRRLKELFFEKFDLSHHFGAIKNYLLLSQGDFAQALMDGLASVLDGDGTMLTTNLTGIVDIALQGSSSFNEEIDQDILERLDVQIMSQSDQSCVGWDVFSLTYRVEDAPLNTVFSRKVMDAYLLIFRFLWKLKRIDHLMSDAYMNLRTLEARRRRLRGYVGESEEVAKGLRRILNRIHFLRMKMTHLVQNIEHYCTVEVLEGSWTILEKEMAAAADLDGMIYAHSKYLTAIKDRTLLSERSRYVARELDAVLDTVIKFSEVQKNLWKWGKWWTDLGTTISDEDIERAQIEKQELEDRIGQVEDLFDVSFEKFRNALKKHSRIATTCMFLVFRLDFNEHYSSRLSYSGEEAG